MTRSIAGGTCGGCSIWRDKRSVLIEPCWCCLNVAQQIHADGVELIVSPAIRLVDIKQYRRLAEAAIVSSPCLLGAAIV